MKIELTSEYEKSRKSTWEFLITSNLVEAARFARDNGWKEQKVQLRVENKMGENHYYVEPYEEGCGCRGILKYGDFFE